jgi:hypothetical protein
VKEIPYPVHRQFDWLETGHKQSRHQKVPMTDTFRLMLCEPTVAKRIKQTLAKKKRDLARWQGPLNQLQSKWQDWHRSQCVIALPTAQPKPRSVRVKKAA